MESHWGRWLSSPETLFPSSQQPMGEAVWGDSPAAPLSTSRAREGSGDSHLGGARQRHFWAFLQAMAGTSSCERDGSQPKFPNILRDYKVYHRWTDPCLPTPPVKSRRRLHANASWMVSRVRAQRQTTDPGPPRTRLSPPPRRRPGRRLQQRPRHLPGTRGVRVFEQPASFPSTTGRACRQTLT